ncbi:MAG: spore germination protein [Clostridia bacterium]
MYDFKEKKLSCNLEKNYEFFKELFEKDDILRTRKLHVNQAVSFDCVLLFMDGMINSDTLNLSIVRPLLVTNKKNEQSSLTQYVLKEILFAAEASESDDIETMLRALLYGDTLLLLENTRKAILINTKGWRTRGITEPNNERILQGPREGFDEAVMLNLAMIRRKLPTPDLCVELQHIGRRTDTKIFICYLDSLVEKKILNELKKRLKQIDIDGVLDSNYINEFIRDGKFSLFKTIGTTERPDIVVARILEGRVAVFVDGTPVVMTLPYLFDENFQSDDDYYLNYFVASIGRILRYVCFFLSISVPGIYIALITAHNQLIPTSFAITIAASRGGVPFSSLSEFSNFIVSPILISNN